MSSAAVDIPDPVGEVLPNLPDSFNGPFFKEVADRKSQGRDVKSIVTAKDGQTGVGKSNLCDFLCYVCDTSAEGFSRGKATIDPPEFLQMYEYQPPGSSIVLEEGGQLDSRRSNSHENVDASHTWQQARVREICSFINLPSPDMIDTRMERLADFWINVERRGLARIYRKRIHPIKRSIYYETVQTLEWPNMDGSDTFREMGKMKDRMLADDDSEDNYVRESEVRKRVEKAKKEATREKRDKILGSVYNDLIKPNPNLTGSDLEACSGVEIGASRISQIANSRD